MEKTYIIILLSFYLIFNISCDINIHVIPHTHLDPGWLKTPEEYYDEEKIGDIFNTVLSQLSNDPKKTFVINELYYFKIWYKSISEEKKNRFKEMLKEKRIEFVSGSYIINDEATPLYYNIADQVRVGHQFLYENFGITPKTGWYIDSFGHSAGNAHIMAQFNFDNLIIGRMHLDFLELMKNTKKYEFFWEPFGTNSNKKILTHILALHYGYNLYFQDLGLTHDEFRNTITSTVRNLINYLGKIKDGIKHKNILYLFGDDFRYSDNSLFLNMDLIINKLSDKNANFDLEVLKDDKNESVNIFYSTPERYFNSMKKELKENNINLEIYSHKDFYPLRTDCFWTGYFTSRPYLKGYIRKASNVFYSLSKYFSFNKLAFNNEIDGNIISDLDYLREAVDLNQHHDAITGTCMQYVSEYYINRLKKGINGVENDLMSEFENKNKIKITKICYNNYIVDENDCSNEFQILDSNIRGNNEIKIGIYNPKFTTASPDGNNKILINIEILNSEYEYIVKEKESDFFCIDEKGLKNKDLYKYKNKCFLNFFYEFKEDEFIIITLKKGEKLKKERYNKFSDEDDKTIELLKSQGNIQSLSFNPSLFEFTLEYFNEDEKINTIIYTYYDGMYYVNSGECNDGAYIFSPYNKYPDEISIDYENSFYYKGNLGITFVTRNDNASFTIFTIFSDPFFAKVEHIFDSLEKSYFLKRFSHGYSFTLRTDINNTDKDNNKPIFYTDANGLEMIKRTIDKFEFIETGDPSTGGNFYPVTSFISIQEENKENNSKNKVTIFNDRAQGATGFLPGSITLILQRLSYGTDNKGLPENMYENESMNTNNFRTTHLIVFGNTIHKYKNTEDKNQAFKYMMQKTDTLNFVHNYFNSATLLFKVEDTSISEYNNKIKETNELIKKVINNNIKISPDIIANYELVRNDLIIGEYFRYNNYFFNKDNNENKDKSFGNIQLNFGEKTNFKIYYDKTGINYFKERKEVFEQEIKEKLKVPKDVSLTLENNEFLYIYYYFGN